jgi:hypothetical protein
LTPIGGGSYAPGENMRQPIAAVLLIGAAGLAGFAASGCETRGCVDMAICVSSQAEADRMNEGAVCPSYFFCDIGSPNDAGVEDAVDGDAVSEHRDASVDAFGERAPLDADVGNPPTGYPDGGSPEPGTQNCDPATHCPIGQFCNYGDQADNCGYPNPGVTTSSGCVFKPPVCTTDCPKVCACDGKWYCNECEANAAGFSIAPSFRCPADGGVTPNDASVSDGGQPTGYPDGGGPPWWDAGLGYCVTNPFNAKGCPSGTWCHDSIHACGYTYGGCVESPATTTCTDDCPGVCGCDQVYYCNECKANAAGVDVWKYGTCSGGGP